MYHVQVYMQQESRATETTKKGIIIHSFNNNHKEFYDCMRKKQQVRIWINNEKKDGRMTESDYEAAEELCSTFQDVFKSKDADGPRAKVWYLELPSNQCMKTHQSTEIYFSAESVVKFEMWQVSWTTQHLMLLKQCELIVAFLLSIFNNLPKIHGYWLYFYSEQVSKH